MYVGVGRDLTLLGLNFGEVIGTFTLTYGSTAAEAALLEAEAGASAAGVLAESNLLLDVRLVLPDGLRRHHGLHRLRCPGRASEDVVLLPLHPLPDGLHLPARRRLDLGRRPGWTTSASSTLPARLSSTAPAVGPRWRASSSSAPASASSAATAAFGPRRPPTFLSLPLASSSSGSAGSASTAARSLPSAAPSTPYG